MAPQRKEEGTRRGFEVGDSFKKQGFERRRLLCSLKEKYKATVEATANADTDAGTEGEGKERQWKGERGETN